MCDIYTDFTMCKTWTCKIWTTECCTSIRHVNVVKYISKDFRWEVIHEFVYHYRKRKHWKTDKMDAHKCVYIALVKFFDSRSKVCSSKTANHQLLQWQKSQSTIYIYIGEKCDSQSHVASCKHNLILQQYDTTSS